MRFWNFAVAVLGALSLVLPSTMAAAAPQNRAGYGKPSGAAKANVNRPKPSGQPNANRPKPQGQGANRPQPNRPQQGRPNKGGNVVSGNTVVVNGGGAGHGYYDNGRYHDRPDWDDDDDDFLEFVGKTAAITAGVSAVTAVIGSVVKDKPSGCQPVNANGTTYQYCNGTYYAQVSNGYEVVAPPPPPQ